MRAVRYKCSSLLIHSDAHHVSQFAQPLYVVLVIVSCVVDVNSLQGQGSVAIADVPDSPLSTVHVLVMHGSTASTLPPLLLNALHGDTCQHGVGCVDAVAVESDFCHGSSIRGQVGRSRRAVPVRQASQHRRSPLHRPAPMRWVLQR